MTAELLPLIAQYGLLLIFVNVLVAQAGLPLPALPTLIFAGALAASGRLPPAGIVAVAVFGCLLSDSLWYWAGRRFGGRLMRTLCRVSLSPDSCVHRAELQFQRWRGLILVIAKFVPGLSTVAPALVGALGLRPRAFVLLDAIGALLWAAVATGLGYAFAAQIDLVLGSIMTAGALALKLALGLLALYVFARWWRRRLLLAALRMPRISPVELQRALAAAPAPLVLDVRSAISRQLDPRVIDSALPADLEHIERAVRGVPFDQALVTYCNCPNEASSAQAAKRLIARGYRDVRPLRGGLDGWVAAGYPVQRLSAAAGASIERSVAKVG